MRVTCGRSKRVHSASYSTTTGLFVTKCGMAGNPIGAWMQEVDGAVTCRSCLKKMNP